MKFLVTGREGQVVKSLTERAAEAGIDLVTLARPDLDLTATPDEIIRIVVPAGAGVDAIINAAAYTAVDTAEREPDLAMAANGAGAGAVAEAAARLGIPVIQLSTDYVFDGSKDGAWREDDKTNPLGVYGASKLAGEYAVRRATPRHAILRTAWVYSPFGQNFVKTMLRLGAEHDRLTIVADQVGSPTSALDIADAVLAIARKLVGEPENGALTGTFHLAGTGETSWAEFARAIFARAEQRGRSVPEVVPILTSDYPTDAARPKNSVLSTDRLHASYGVRLSPWQTSLDTVLDRLIEAAN